MAIFTVSAVVALVSVIYLVKLIISKAGNKKEAGSGEEAPNKEQPTREVTKESVLKNKPIGRGFNNTVEFETQPNPSASVSPPPPLPSLPHSAAPTPPPPAIQINPPEVLRNAKKNKTGASASTSNSDFHVDLAKAVKEPKLRRIGVDDVAHVQQDSKGSSATPESDENNTKRKTSEEIDEMIKDGKKKKKQEQLENNPAFKKALQTRSIYSESEDEHENDVSGSEWEDERLTPQIHQPDNKKRSKSPDNDHISSDNENRNANQVTVVQASLGSQLGHRERSESSDSCYRSSDNIELKPISSLHSAPEVEEPSLPSKPANLHTRPESPLIEKENGADLTSSKLKEPSALSFKERAELFENYR